MVWGGGRRLVVMSVVGMFRDHTKFKNFSTTTDDIEALKFFFLRPSMFKRINQTTLNGVRFASNKAKPTNKHRASIPTRFPTEFNPVRSASNPRIKLPKGLSFNPAPSAPSPYYTPSAFLPDSDKRQVKYESKKYDVDNMPSITEPDSKKYNLTTDEITEMQKLRSEDPVKWNRKALAEKFGCSQFFVSMATKAPKGHLKEMDRRLSVIKSLWTETRTRTRRDRVRRRELALRDAN